MKIKEDKLYEILTPEIKYGLGKLKYDISGHFSDEELDDLETSIFGEYELKKPVDSDESYWVLENLSLEEVIEFINHDFGGEFYTSLSTNFVMNNPSVLNDDLIQGNFELLKEWIESVT